MTFKKGYIEVCLTTEDGIQHLRCHGWLKRERVLIKAEQVFNNKGEDFGMFIIVIESEEFEGLINLKDDLFKSFDVMSQEEERWNTYKKKKDKDFIQNISNFMFSLTPEDEIDIDDFIIKSNEATLRMFKISDEFKGDYVMNNFMTTKEKLNDLDTLIEFFEDKERYEDCSYLLQIIDKIKSNEKFKLK